PEHRGKQYSMISSDYFGDLFCFKEVYILWPNCNFENIDKRSLFEKQIEPLLIEHYFKSSFALRRFELFVLAKAHCPDFDFIEQWIDANDIILKSLQEVSNQ